MRGWIFAPLSLATLVVAGVGCVSNIGSSVDCSQNPEASACTNRPDAGGNDELAAPARIFVDPPFGVGFDCVAVGCDETRILTVENRGERNLAINLVRMSVESSSEFTTRLVEIDGDILGGELPNPSGETPEVVRPGGTVAIEVRYVPVDALADEGTLWIEWFDTLESYDDAEIHREELAISTRVLGDAVAELETPVLGYGYVAVGQSRDLLVRVTNATTGTAILALEPPVPSAETPGNFQSLATETVFVSPGETAELPIRFTPNGTEAFFGSFTIATNDGGEPQLTVVVRGTAIADPWLEVAAPDGWELDFGNVRIGDSVERDVVLRNLGGLPLLITPTLPTGSDVGFSADVALGAQLPAINPLEERVITVSASPVVGGALDGRLSLTTNDPTLPEDYVDLHAFGIAPDAAFTPAALDFGTVVQSWTSPAQTVTISNQGTGELTIEALDFDVGSSSMVRLVAPAMLPVKLSGDGTLDVALFVQGDTLGPANATLLVYTDSIEDPVRRVDISAFVVTCQEGCPVANGVPSCNSGSCQVGNCLPGWHDPDHSFSSGCECAEDNGGEIGDACSSGISIGTLYDDSNPSSVQRTGTLHSDSDVDLYYFNAYDESEFLNDSYRAVVTLLSAPPGLEVCARFANWGSGCGGLNQANCSTSEVRGQGNGVGDDSEDVTVWVRWQPGAAPMCGEYTLRMRADGG